MNIYILLILTWCIIYFIENQALVHLSHERVLYRQKLCVIAFCALLLFFCAFRAYDYERYVGVDTYAYANAYQQVIHWDFHKLLINAEEDTGYYALCWGVSKLGFSFRAVLILEAIVYITAVYKLIREYSMNPLLSLLVFVSLGLYTFSFSTIRQTYAMSFALLGYLYYRKHVGKKALFGYILMQLLAISFHASALVFFPAFLISKMKYNRKMVGFFVFVAVVVLVFKNQFVRLAFTVINALTDQYSNYAATSDSVGGKLYLMVAAFVLFDILYQKKELNQSNNFIYFMLMVLILFPIVSSGGALMRAYFYYYLFAVVEMPNTIAKIKDFKVRNLLKYGFIAFLILLFMTNDFYGSKLLPYHMF